MPTVTWFCVPAWVPLTRRFFGLFFSWVFIFIFFQLADEVTATDPLNRANVTGKSALC